MSESAFHKSALTDHTSQLNHVIDWDATSIVEREDNYARRQILEAMRIRQTGDTALNRDELMRVTMPCRTSGDLFFVQYQLQIQSSREP